MTAVIAEIGEAVAATEALACEGFTRRISTGEVSDCTSRAVYRVIAVSECGMEGTRLICEGHLVMGTDRVGAACVWHGDPVRLVAVEPIGGAA
ncbi:hypothetical protein KIH74_25510 [Kineosporia sp. J2-2]|uniref:Uncharacterized protein n=1 Tax=Kineosporia corallincola TaxID=2835133 RepID=A0ABS5TNA9_9ACTN|nr:hypothetical protein [Kineosporia corallincola]MBT0772328.1 hypothetical protein [Kineosporia corallincola]